MWYTWRSLPYHRLASLMQAVKQRVCREGTRCDSEEEEEEERRRRRRRRERVSPPKPLFVNASTSFLLVAFLSLLLFTVRVLRAGMGWVRGRGLNREGGVAC